MDIEKMMENAAQIDPNKPRETVEQSLYYVGLMILDLYGSRKLPPLSAAIDELRMLARNFSDPIYSGNVMVYQMTQNLLNMVSQMFPTRDVTNG